MLPSPIGFWGHLKQKPSFETHWISNSSSPSFWHFVRICFIFLSSHHYSMLLSPFGCSMSLMAVKISRILWKEMNCTAWMSKSALLWHPSYARDEDPSTENSCCRLPAPISHFVLAVIFYWPQWPWHPLQLSKMQLRNIIRYITNWIISIGILEYHARFVQHPIASTTPLHNHSHSKIFRLTWRIALLILQWTP